MEAPRLAGRWARSALEELARRTDGSSRVLIVGEEGTGKLHLARALHWAWHPDGTAPLEVVRCGDGSGEETLLKELFGWDARASRQGRGLYWPGALERASGGTAILARADGLSAKIRAKLEDFLDTGEVIPVDGDRRTIGPCALIITVRSMASVPQGLASRMPIRLEVPPLRQRRGDIEDLFWHFAALEGVDFFPAEAAKFLASLDWPGNARELRDAVRTEARRWREAGGRPTEELLGEFEALLKKATPARKPTKKELILACAPAVASGKMTPEEVAKRTGASMIYTKRLLRATAGGMGPTGL